MRRRVGIATLAGGLVVLSIMVFAHPGSHGAGQPTVDLRSMGAMTDAVSAFAPVRIGFDVSLSFDTGGRVDTWVFVFGDGVTETHPVADTLTITHDYLTAGTYNATCTVYDTAGNSDVDTMVITVQAFPTPPQFVKYSNNPIVTRTGNTSNFEGWGFYTMPIRKEGSTFYGWPTGLDQSGGQGRIGYMTSNDGLSWTQTNGASTKNSVLSSGGAIFSRGVSRSGNSLYMVYTSGGVTRLAVSSDGVTWSDSGVILNSSGDATRFDEQRAQDASAPVFANGQWHIFFNGLTTPGGAQRLTIGHAVSSNLVNWTTLLGPDSSPVRRGAVLWHHKGSGASNSFTGFTSGETVAILGAPSVWHDGTNFHMVYSTYVYDTDAAFLVDGLKRAVLNYAVSVDGHHWSPYQSGPILDLGPRSSYDEWGLAAPCAFYDTQTSTVYLTYEGSSRYISTGRGNICLATAGSSSSKNSPPVILTATATASSGAAPMLVTFSGTGTDTDGYVTQWEFNPGFNNGNGPSPSEAYYINDTSFTRTYLYTNPGTYRPGFVIHDNAGAFDHEYITTITVTAPTVTAGYTFTATPTTITAGETVGFRLTLSDSARVDRIELDLDGDRLADRVYPDVARFYAKATLQGETYGLAGTFTPRVRVFLQRDTDSQWTFGDSSVTITVNAGGGPPTSTGTVSETIGFTPFEVRFTASGAAGGTPISFFEWDFKGDSIWDWRTSTAGSQQLFLFDAPGTYVATQRVVARDGREARNSITIFAQSVPLPTATFQRPDSGDVLNKASGPHTLHLKVNKQSRVASVAIRGRTPAGADSVIATLTSPPWRTSWTTTGAATGYWLLATDVTLTNGDVYQSETIGITLLSSGGGEEKDSGANRVYKLPVSRDRERGHSTREGLEVNVPLRIFDADDTLEVTWLDSSTVSLPGLRDSTPIFNLSFSSGDTRFSKGITITVPYPDADNNGIVDGTSLSETQVSIFWYDESSLSWREYSGVVVDPINNTVTVTTAHFTTHALGAGSFSAASGTSAAGEGGGWCVITRAWPVGALSFLRSIRDLVLSSGVGRLVTSLYYAFGGLAG